MKIIALSRHESRHDVGIQPSPPLSFSESRHLRIELPAFPIEQEAGIRDYWNALKNTKNIGQGMEQQRQVLNDDTQKLQQIIQALTDKDLQRAARNAKKIFLTLSVHSQRIVGSFLSGNNPTLPEFHEAVMSAIKQKQQELQSLNKGHLEYDPQNLTKQVNPYHQIMRLLQGNQFSINHLKAFQAEIAKLISGLTPANVQQMPSMPPSAAEPMAQTANTK